ncbi:hypothetical protein VaNZ11_000672 [Volvox africanus]|uniref:NACHT domain-containing protein n=1 Tax=Volvox africanus TaxID=51714 RepID=A0ABQ5RNR6_9CHLO|nr:hypothetical protein VaNZ11_000672 [Volvox africanus]
MGCAASAPATTQVDTGAGVHEDDLEDKTTEKEKRKVLPEQFNKNLPDTGSLSGSLDASVALLKTTELTCVQEFDIKPVHSMVEKRRSSVHSQNMAPPPAEFATVFRAAPLNALPGLPATDSPPLSPASATSLPLLRLGAETPASTRSSVLPLAASSSTLPPALGSSHHSPTGAQGSRVLPEVDQEGAVSPIIRGPLPPVDARRRGSVGLFNASARTSTDGNLEAGIHGNGELLFSKAGARPSADGNCNGGGSSNSGGGGTHVLSGGGGGGGGSGLLAGFSGTSNGPGTVLFRGSANLTGILKSSGGVPISPGSSGGSTTGAGHHISLSNARGGGGGGGGARNILLKEGCKTTYVVEKVDDDLADEDFLSDDGDGHIVGGSDGRLRGHSLAPIRMESISEPQQPDDILGGPSFRTGSQALLIKKSLLAPSKMLMSGDSQACLGVAHNGLPPVKQTGHRSIGSRSVGMRPEISFALSARDVATPHIMRGRRTSTSACQGPPRAESAVSTATAQGSAAGVGPDSGCGSRFNPVSLEPEGVSDDVPGSAGDVDPGRASRRPPKRGGKEWDARNARWRRASVFESSAHCAISLRFLRKLLTEHVMTLADRLKVPLGQVTTLMVNEMVVKELTREEQCRLVDVPGLVPVEDVGEPDYFISHAWGNPFAHLVQCVCDHLSGALESTKVWIDIAAVNQHPSDQQQDDLANLRNAIYKSKATLMCLDVTGAPLKRVWCLYECDNTITIHGPDRLVLLTPNFSVKDMASVFTSINVVDAGAYKQSDKDKILEDIIDHHGSYTAFDNKLKLLFLLEPLDMQADLEALLEGTGGAQEYDFSPLQMWLTSPRSPQVCVISGPAGSGKSTISAALCWDEKARQRRDKTLARGRVHLPNGAKLARQISGLEVTSDPIVHAYHFCKYSDVRRQSPIRIVKTLAYQLAQRFPLLRTYYAELDLGEIQQLHQASTAFRLLLLKPLTTLLPRDEQVVLLIDAMDEADSASQLPLDNSILQLMLHQLSCLPRNVRVITSTRSAPHLMGPLRRKFNGALELTPAMVRKRETTLTALERRLTSRFGATAAAAMMGRASGETNLVYYSVVMLLDPPLDMMPVDLPTCYHAVFSAIWPRLSAQQRSDALKVLQVLMAAREPLQLSLLAGLGLDHVLELLPGWGTLLYEREYRVFTLHKSLHDWLSDPGLAGEFHADPRIGHATLARYLFNAAHPLSSYGSKYLVTHLLAAEQLKELLDQVVTDLDHLEAVCRVGYVFRLHAELAAAEPKSRAVADVVRWLGLNSHVLWAHPSAVVQLANEAPNSSAFIVALRRPRRSSTITTEILCAAEGALKGTAAAYGAAAGAGPPVTLLNKRRSWPAQLSILAQHHRAVNSVSFNPAGTLLASGSEDRSVRLWDPLTGEQKAVLFGHLGQVLGVAFSPNGAYIASASVDSTVRLWDASTGEEKAELAGHVDWVRDVAFAPTGAPGVPGRLLASCGDDKSVKLWDLAGPQPQIRYTMLGHTDIVSSVCWMPDGSLIASASTDLSIRLWDPTTGRQAGRALVAHKSPVTCVCFSPDGKLLASGSHDKLILLWDMAACREGGIGPAMNAKPMGELAGHVDKVLCVNFSPDGKLLVSASADGSMRLWSMEERRTRGLLLGHASNVVAAAFAPGGHLVASAASDNTVRLWDPRVATESGSIEESYASHMDMVTHVAFSPSGHTVASAGADWTVRLWDPSDGNHRAMLQGHTDVVRCVAFSPTGHLLASASSDWTVRLWDPVSKVEKALLAGHQDRVLAVTWAPNSRMLASACHSGNIIIWDAISLTSIRQLKGHAAPVHALAFSPNSKVLASGSADKTVRLWQPQLGEQQVLIRGHMGAVMSLEYDVSGKLLASSSLEEKMVRVWDPASGTLLCVISNAALCSPGPFSMYSLARHAPCVRAIALKPRLTASGSGGAANSGAARPVSPGAAFGRMPSFTPSHLLQPSMTMRLERSSPNGLVIGGPQTTDYTFTFNRPVTPVPACFGGAPGGAGSLSPRDGGAGTPPVLQTAMSMRSSLSSMDEIPRLMELVSEADNPIVPIFTPFVGPKSVAVHGNKVVMSDGPHMYFFESNEGKLVGWKSRIQSAGL